jgi:hypothetical protein
LQYKFMVQGARTDAVPAIFALVGWVSYNDIEFHV